MFGTPLTPMGRSPTSMNNVNIRSPSIFDISSVVIGDNNDSNKIINNKTNELRNIYNERVNHINNILLDICNSIGNDSLINSLLNDDVSTGYIYSHLSEVMNKHLDDEREIIFQNISKRLSIAEYDISKERSITTQLKHHIHKIETELHRMKDIDEKHTIISQRYNKLEKSFQDLALQAQIETESLKNNVKTLSLLNDETNKRLDDNHIIANNTNDDNKKLQRLLDESKNKTFLLEKKLLQCNHEILLLKAVEDKEMKIKSELQDNYEKLLLSKDTLNDDNNILKEKLVNNENELIRLNELLNKKAEEDAKNKQSINLLMNQVENLLHKESMESNKVINTINEKNYDKQQKMHMEIEKLKKANTFLQEENMVLLSQKNSKTREIESKTEEEHNLKNRVMINENTINNLKNKIQEMSAEKSDLKLKNSELLAAVELGKLRVEEIQKKKDDEMKMIEAKIKFESKKENDMDRLRDENFYNAYKFRYMNELGLPRPMPSPVSSSSSSYPDPNFNLNASYNVNATMAANTPDSKSTYRTLDTTSTPFQTPFTPAVNSLMNLPHKGLPHDTSAFSMAHAHIALDTHKEKAATEKTRIETQMQLDKINYENKISVMSGLLKEANENIETLKNMVINHREALKHATSWEDKHSELLDDHGQLKQEHGNSKKEARQSAERIHELEVEQAHLKQVLGSYRNKDIDSFDYKEENINLKVRVAKAEERAKDRDHLETQVVRLKKLNASLAQSMGSGSPSPSLSSNIQSSNDSANSNTTYSMNSTLNEFKKEINRLKGLLDQKTNENLKLNEEILRMKIELKTSDDTNIVSKHNNDYHALEDEFAKETLKLKLELEKERNNSQKLESDLYSLRSEFEKTRSELTDLRKIDISVLSPHHHHQPPPVINNTNYFSPKDTDDTDLNLSTQMSTIKALENNLRRKLEVADMSINEIEYEKDEHMRIRKQFFMYQKVLQEICTTYSNVIFGLRERLQITKAGIEKMKTVFAIDMQKALSKISQKFQIENERSAHLHSRELQSTRINLSKAHDIEKARLEKSFKEQVTALTRRHERDTKTQKDEFVLQTDRVMNLTNKGLSGPSISVYAFESVLTGVLDALSNNNMIQSSDADMIIDIAKSNKDPSFTASADARLLLSEILFKTIKELNDTKGDIEYMKAKFRRAGLSELLDTESSSSPTSPFVSPMTAHSFSPDRSLFNKRDDMNSSTPIRESRSNSQSSPSRSVNGSPSRSVNGNVNGTPSRSVNWLAEIVDGF